MRKFHNENFAKSTTFLLETFLARCIEIIPQTLTKFEVLFYRNPFRGCFKSHIAAIKRLFILYEGLELV